jgi:branched-subunit amino acid transport protein
MDHKIVTLTIAGMAVVTYLPRLLPLLFLAQNGEERRTFSPLVEAWLRYVPVAVLAALLLPSLVVVEGRANLAWDNLYLWAALPTLGVAWKTRSLFAAVLTGMAFVALGRLWSG